MSIQYSQTDGQSGQAVASGWVIVVRGAVIDADFTGQMLPAVDTAMMVSIEAGRPVLVEVQAHVSGTVVRALALHATAGIARGMSVHSTGRPITVPVGTCALGRLLDGSKRPCGGETRDAHAGVAHRASR